MRIPRQARITTAACAALALSIGVSACSSSTESADSSASTSSTATAAPLDAAALKAQLPERIRASGKLIVGTEAPFAPMVTKEGNTLAGFDIALTNKVAETLGVKADFQQLPFAQLVTDVQNGALDTAARGIFDTKAREQSVDMVSYLRAGTQWAARSDAKVDPVNACGLKVGAEAGTTQLTVELPAKSQACETVGEKKIDVVSFDTERAAMQALADGKVDAVSADSPVIRYAAHESKGKITAIGHSFDTTSYSFPVAKGSPLGPVLQKVIQHLIDTGEMKSLTEKWGLGGMLKQSTLNSAIN